jgi:hypothetical protein
MIFVGDVELNEVPSGSLILSYLYVDVQINDIRLLDAM